MLLEQDEKVLEIEARRTIYNVVKECAGSHFREIQRKSGLAVGSVQHHLHALVKAGLIKEVKRGKNVLYFPREFTPGNMALLSLLRQKSVRAILLFLLTQERPAHEQIVAFVKLSPSTVSWHLKRLQGEGLVVAESEGRKTFFFLNYDKDALVKLLITYQESFVDRLVDRVVEMWSFD